MQSSAPTGRVNDYAKRLDVFHGTTADMGKPAKDWLTICTIYFNATQVSDGALAERPVQALKILIDTGASHSFVSQRVVTENHIPLTPVVSQPGGSLRKCVDYHALNKHTVKNRYQLPRIDGLLTSCKVLLYYQY